MSGKGGRLALPAEVLVRSSAWRVVRFTVATEISTAAAQQCSTHNPVPRSSLQREKQKVDADPACKACRILLRCLQRPSAQPGAACLPGSRPLMSAFPLRLTTCTEVQFTEGCERLPDSPVKDRLSQLTLGGLANEALKVNGA
jgi:hypothetical protein